MLRGLYRFYLYAVFIAMLLFAAFGVQGLLQTALALTIFPEPYSTLSNANLVQAAVLAVVALVTAGLFGGLHYWLIRKDMRNDALAANGAVRAFFLNAVEVISLPSAVGTAAFTITGLGSANAGGASFGAAYALTFLSLWALIEWERRRAPASTGAASVFQRLHLYGAQLILLFILTWLWLETLGTLVDELFFRGKGTGIPACGGLTVCQGPNLLSLLAGTLWVVLFWLGYGLLSRRDTTSLLRKVLHFLSFGYGVVAVLVGIYRAVSLLLLFILHVPVEPRNISGPFAEYDILSPLTLGLLVVGVYIFWLRHAAQKQGEAKAEVSLTVQAIATALLGVSFWWGCGLIVLNALEYMAPSHTPLQPEDWVTALALGITGIAYIPLEMLLRRHSTQAAYIAPLRGFVLTLLGGGILAGAIGGATALYSYGTSLLGSPLDNWQYAAHAGLAAFVVGLSIVGLCLRTAIRAGFFHSTAKEETTPTTSVVNVHSTISVPAEDKSAEVATITSSPIAKVIDNLLAGKISRDDAIMQIEHMMNQTV
jgi:hypothetical protein